MRPTCSRQIRLPVGIEPLRLLGILLLPHTALPIIARGCHDTLSKVILACETWARTMHEEIYMGAGMFMLIVSISCSPGILSQNDRLENQTKYPSGSAN